MSLESHLKKAEGDFIVFEGIDFSGKGEQIRKFVEYLRTKSQEVSLTEEPWSGGLRKEIKEKISQEKGDKEEILELYLTDRIMHINTFVKPTLAQGKTVVCDRYDYSTVAYQGTQGFTHEELVKKVSKNRFAPDVCFYIDISAKESMARKQQVLARSERSAIDDNVLFENLDFQTGVRERYLKLAKDKENFSEIIVIDGNGTVDEVHQRIVQAYESYLVRKSESS
jgi:dTMP kinase